MARCWLPFALASISPYAVPLPALLARAPWPDAIDLISVVVVATLMLGLPLMGYIFMALDYRAYVRSLRKALVLVRGYLDQLPEWVRRDAPPCLQALGLTMPCTREQVLTAYRDRVKRLHPDAGGSREQFARLQRHFEQALSLAEPDR